MDSCLEVALLWHQSYLPMVIMWQGRKNQHNTAYHTTGIVEPVLKDYPTCHTNVVSQDRWSLATCSVTLKCRTFCYEYLVFQDRWSLMAVASQERFHCSNEMSVFRLLFFVCVFVRGTIHAQWHTNWNITSKLHWAWILLFHILSLT